MALMVFFVFFSTFVSSENNATRQSLVRVESTLENSETAKHTATISDLFGIEEKSSDFFEKTTYPQRNVTNFSPTTLHSYVGSPDDLVNKTASTVVTEPTAKSLSKTTDELKTFPDFSQTTLQSFEGGEASANNSDSFVSAIPASSSDGTTDPVTDFANFPQTPETCEGRLDHLLNSSDPTVVGDVVTDLPYHCAASTLNTNCSGRGVFMGSAFHADDPMDVHCWVQGTAGHVTWTDRKDRCQRYVHWHIQTPMQNHGIVFKGDFDNFQAYAVGLDLPCGPFFDKRNYYSYISQETLLFSHHQVLVLVNPIATFGIPKDSSFNFSFVSYPLKEMPVIANRTEMSDHEQLSVKARIMYNCSQPYTVPDWFQCDMVQHCVQGEDEPVNCQYRAQGCDWWLPHKDKCYKILISDSAPDDREFHRPSSAYETCRSEDGATLAVLSEKDETGFLMDVFARSGNGQSLGPLPSSARRVRTESSKLAQLYRFLWQSDGKGSPVLYNDPLLQRGYANTQDECAELQVYKPTGLRVKNCRGVRNYLYTRLACIKPRITRPPTVPGPRELQRPSRLPAGFQTRRCADGSFVQAFVPCPFSAADGVGAEVSVMRLPLFACHFAGQRIHYTLVCDGVQDCVDGTDEEGCAAANFTAVAARGHIFICENHQIIPASFRCNGAIDCFDGSDEVICKSCVDHVRVSMTWCFFFEDMNCVPLTYSRMRSDGRQDIHKSCLKTANITLDTLPNVRSISPPAVVNLDGFGLSTLAPLAKGERCPETHWQCPGGYCIPTYLLNNGEKDCLHGEDEIIRKENLLCPGFYRCYGTATCVHADYVCDGIYHCANKDDERFCDVKCPKNCTCEGFAFKCGRVFDAYTHFYVRYLDLSGADNLQLWDARRARDLALLREELPERSMVMDIAVLQFLLFLNVSSCGLTKITLVSMSLLQVLDLSYNDFKDLSDVILVGLSRLTHLNLSGNHFMTQLDARFSKFIRAGGMAQLQTLSLVDTDLMSILSTGFYELVQLHYLDIRENTWQSLDKDTFRNLTSLQILLSDDPRLCCDYFLAGLSVLECVAPEDELSSCADLLRSDFFRVCLWSQSVLAILGNAGVLVYRLCVETEGTSLAYRVLVINLTMADLLMGVYLAVIGAADVMLEGEYVSKAAQWVHSYVCTASGFLAFVSAEVSALTICLITVDRLLVLGLPFSHGLHLHKRSALFACLLTWLGGVCLAAVPLVHSHWQFYSQNGICLSLPITRRRFPGHEYAFGVFIVLNFALFVLIGAGQLFIYRVVRRSARLVSDKGRLQQDVTIAKRLLLIVFSDFCCWFPIGLMGLLASHGVPVSDEVNVWAAIFVLPLNSALNPFLYTLNAVRDRWAKRRAEARIDRAVQKLRVQLESWPSDRAQELMSHFFRSRLAYRLRTSVSQQAGVQGSQTTHGSVSPATSLRG